MENLRQVFQICQQLVDQILQKQSLSSNFSHQNEFIASPGSNYLSMVRAFKYIDKQLINKPRLECLIYKITVENRGQQQNHVKYANKSA
jgi:hypothetical protein